MKRKTNIVLWCIMALVITLIIMSAINFDRPSGHTVNIDSTKYNKIEEAQIVKDIHMAEDRTPSIFPADWNMSHEVEKAVTKGAPAKVTLKVVDSTGKAVPNAQVMLNFTFYERKDSFLEGVTDDQGFFTGQKETMSAYNWSIKKDGYYSTVGRYSFIPHLTNDSIKNGRWQPWNPTIVVVLKEKQNPIQLVQKNIKIIFPKEKEVEFDIKQGKLLPPFGDGKSADILFYYWSDYSYKNRNAITNRLDINTKLEDGFIRFQQDSWSELKTVREAPTDGYQAVHFKLLRTNQKIIDDNTMKPNEYFIFKFLRNELSKNERYYGKIYSFEYGECYPHTNDCMVIIRYRINETPNDRNLEDAEKYPTF